MYCKFTASEDPCINESGAASLEGSGQRQRRLSYTLDEPSPVLLAYMERFGQTSTAQTEVGHFDEILFLTWQSRCAPQKTWLHTFNRIQDFFLSLSILAYLVVSQFFFHNPKFH